MRLERDLRMIVSAMSLLVLMTVMSTAGAQWRPDMTDKLQVKTHSTVLRIKDKMPRTEQYFADAYGYAVLPSIGRIGAGFGGSYGKGLVIADDNLVGKTGFWQFTSGIQAGVKSFSMIVFFRDPEALDYFKKRKVQFLGQAGLTLGPVGVNGTPAYNDGVAIFTLTRFGLMGEFTVSGAKFTYEDLPSD